MPLISLFKFVNWITGTPHAIEDGVSSSFTLPLQQQIIDAMNQAPFLASGSNHRAGFVPDPGATPGITRFLREDAIWATVSTNPFLDAALPYFAPEGRLTLSTTEVVMTSSVSAASSLYYYPYVGSIIPYFDGTSLWNLYDMGNAALPTFTLDSNSGHTGYHQVGKIFDVFFDYNAGSGRLVTGPAWTSNSARADAIVRQNGLWLNNASIVCRFGTASGDTATFNAKTLTYLGSFYCLADGQTGFIYGSSAAGGGAAYFALWNCYNRRTIYTRVTDNTATWSVSALGTLNGSTNNRISYLYGLPEDSFFAFINHKIDIAAAGNIAATTLGFNTTSAITGSWMFSIAGSIVGNPVMGGPSNGWDGSMTMGWNFFQGMQTVSGGSATITGTTAFSVGGIYGQGSF